jgi:uncharacterized membrane protein YqgA involved in biofilm formation
VIIIVFLLYLNTMLGPTVNAIAIVVCGLAGCLLVKGIPSRIDDILNKAIGLSVLLIGVKGAVENENFIPLIHLALKGLVLRSF